MLGELVPRFLDRMPSDPLTGGVLHYVRLPEGSFKLDSLGPDGRDDAGRMETNEDVAANESGRISSGFDWVWTTAVKE